MWYLVVAQDRAIVPEHQRLMQRLAREAGADITVWEIESGHPPFLSQPEERVIFAREAVNALLAR